jgi:hypothetical protein
VSVLAFRLPSSTAQESRSTSLCVFLSISGLVPADIWSAIEQDAAENFSADSVVFLAPCSHLESLQATLAGADAKIQFARLGRPNVGIVRYEASGDVGSVIPIIENDMPLEFDWLRVRRMALMEIFNRHEGFLHQVPGFHYRNPSGFHSGRFIRASNLLVGGTEVMFVALCALKHIGKAEIIYVDTSTISAVGFAAGAIRKALDPMSSIPSVETFGSYPGLSRGFRFRRIDQAVVLMSASTAGKAGGLARLLQKEHSIPLDKTLTLFWLGEDAPNNPVLCDLSRDSQDNPRGILERITTYPEHDCPFCRDGSAAIELVEDQFILRPRAPATVQLREQDAFHCRDLMERYYETEIFSIRVRAGGDRRPVHVELPQLLKNDAFVKRVAYAAKRVIPASVDLVIRLDDNDSLRFSEAVMGIVGKRGRKVVSASELDNRSPETNNNNAVLVIAGAIGNGSALRHVSRTLRIIRPASPRVYLSGFARAYSADALRALEMDLKHSDLGIGHGFHAVEELLVPRKGSYDPWEAEQRTLEKLEMKLAETGDPSNIRERVVKRLEVLRTPSLIGKDLFLMNNERPAALNKGFAFWKFSYEPEQVNAGALFTTVASVLQRRRTESNRSGRLWTSPYEATVLAPGSFERFNEPLLQACFLRAARPAELNYGAARDLSREMAWTARSAVAISDHRGAAGLEFALSLATGQLTLTQTDLNEARQWSVPDLFCAALLELAIERATHH